MTDAGLTGMVEAVVDPEGYLAEDLPEPGTPGWGYAADDEATAAARERAVKDALRALEGLLATAIAPPNLRTSKKRTPAEEEERVLRASTLLLTVIDRELTAKDGYLKRLRAKRSELLRQRHAAGVSAGDLAREQGVSVTRIHQLMANNKTYLSPARAAALVELSERSEAERAVRRAEVECEAAENAAAKEAAAAARREAREAAKAGERARDLAEGRRLLALVDAGRRPAELATESMSWQRVAALVRLARADAERAASA